ncbi:MAG TPA: NAD(P)H-dependent oxidoreductase [Thermodesulfobacteriota bacterium]|nr:NAD(P)H-dependent oxidoreductase [Thermodesulfobacteriota bacterium]
MKCLLVTAHPLRESLCSALSDRAAEALREMGHEVIREDLYGDNFNAELTIKERRTYYASSYDFSEVKDQVARLLEAEAIVLVFPTWWFGFPAILKGWFDRVWGPGIAYDHAGDFGPIKPRLKRLRHLAAVTTLGSPWWVDRLLLRQPVKRVLKSALLGACAPTCRFKMRSFYKCEQLSEVVVDQFSAKMTRMFRNWK